MDIERRTLYHLILTEIGKTIDIEQSKSIYTRDHGFPPEFIMDVVGYFTKMQEIADEYLDRLLEKYESLNSDNDEEDGKCMVIYHMIKHCTLRAQQEMK